MRFDEVRQLIGDPNSRAHKRSRLLSRILVAADRPSNERYHLDLNRRILEYQINGSTVTWGDILLIGTHSFVDGSWLWGFENPSVPEKATEPVKQLFQFQKDLLESCVVFATSGEDFEQHEMCDYIAEKLGYLAAFPAETENVIAWLAVNPSLRKDWPADHPENVWCDLCGIPKHNVPVVFTGLLGRVCNECVTRVTELCNESDFKVRADNPSTDVSLFLPPCIVTGQYLERVCTPYSAISYFAASELLKHPNFPVLANGADPQSG